MLKIQVWKQHSPERLYVLLPLLQCKCIAVKRLILACIFLILCSFSILFCSLPIFAISTKICEINHSSTCYSNCSLIVLPNSTTYANMCPSLILEDQILAIHFTSENGNIDFEIVHKRRLDLGTSYQEYDYYYRRFGERLVRPVPVPIIKFAEEWATMETYPNVSSFSMNYTVPSEGLYSLKFENTELQNTKNVTLSVIKDWKEIQRETIISSLIPPTFSYVGLSILFVGVLAIFYIKNRKLPLKSTF